MAKWVSATTCDVSDYELLPDLGDDGEGDVAAGVGCGDGVDDGSGGEEEEDEEEGEVDELEEPEVGPRGGDEVGEVGVGFGADWVLIQLELVVEDLGEEEVGDLDVGEEDEGEGG
ncbi:transmembrane protein, putative [Actinidia rufa]|uniref:Transmembrane protein, putative n=1 Tax=Actinidia rufa TaxID=165716 RepID=A0A7J0F9F4_9ERIC|nr:transmembrane protein, putative [Actinidia rufa]